MDNQDNSGDIRDIKQISSLNSAGEEIETVKSQHETLRTIKMEAGVDAPSQENFTWQKTKYEEKAIQETQSLISMLRNQAENNEWGLSFIHKFIMMEDLKNLELFLACGENPDTLTMKESISPLQLAIEKGNIDIIRILLAYGAQINVHHGCHLPPLFCAIHKDNKQIVQLLLNAGGNPQQVYTIGSKSMNACNFAYVEDKMHLLPLLHKYSSTEVSDLDGQNMDKDSPLSNNTSDKNSLKFEQHNNNEKELDDDGKDWPRPPQIPLWHKCLMIFAILCIFMIFILILAPNDFTGILLWGLIPCALISSLVFIGTINKDIENKKYDSPYFLFGIFVCVAVILSIKFSDGYDKRKEDFYIKTGQKAFEQKNYEKAFLYFNKIKEDKRTTEIKHALGYMYAFGKGCERKMKPALDLLYQNSCDSVTYSINSYYRGIDAGPKHDTYEEIMKSSPSYVSEEMRKGNPLPKAATKYKIHSQKSGYEPSKILLFTLLIDNPQFLNGYPKIKEQIAKSPLAALHPKLKQYFQEEQQKQEASQQSQIQEQQKQEASQQSQVNETTEFQRRQAENDERMLKFLRERTEQMRKDKLLPDSLVINETTEKKMLEQHKRIIRKIRDESNKKLKIDCDIAKIGYQDITRQLDLLQKEKNELEQVSAHEETSKESTRLETINTKIRQVEQKKEYAETAMKILKLQEEEKMFKQQLILADAQTYPEIQEKLQKTQSELIKSEIRFNMLKKQIAKEQAM